MGERVAAIIILAGGTAARLGGISKPDFRVGGERLIDILFDHLAATGFIGQRIVVAPGTLDVPPGVRLTLEDPPHGGPLAGIGAGVRALFDINDDDLVALATCDAPVAVRLLPDLADMYGAGRLDGIVPLNDDGWPQYTHGLYRAGALRRIAFERDGSVRRAFGGLDLATIVDAHGHCVDVDSPDDVPLLLAHIKHVKNRH